MNKDSLNSGSYLRPTDLRPAIENHTIKKEADGILNCTTRKL